MTGLFTKRIWQPCICQTNELKREIKKKTGGAKRGAKQKSGPLESPLLLDYLIRQLENEVVNFRRLKRKIHSELEINNQLESLNYLRLDGQIQMVSDLSMNNHKIVLLSPPTMPDHAVNTKFLDDTVNDLARDLTTENQRYTDNLILQSAENRSAEIERLNFLINTQTFQASDGVALQNFNINEHTLSGISIPVKNSDAAPQSYVDDFFLNGA